MEKTSMLGLVHFNFTLVESARPVGFWERNQTGRGSYRSSCYLFKTIPTPVPTLDVRASLRLSSSGDSLAYQRYCRLVYDPTLRHNLPGAGDPYVVRSLYLSPFHLPPKHQGPTTPDSALSDPSSSSGLPCQHFLRLQVSAQRGVFGGNVECTPKNQFAGLSITRLFHLLRGSLVLWISASALADHTISSKAHAQHPKSRSHVMWAARGSSHSDDESAIIKPFVPCAEIKLSQQRDQDDEDSEDTDEWEEAHLEEDLLGEAMDSHNTIESCMVHMHKQHGFFIPNVEYLKDPKGLLYLSRPQGNIFNEFSVWDPGLKGISCACTAMRDVILSTAWKQLENIWQQKVNAKCITEMVGDDEEVEEFYDYSSSYIDADGKQLVAYNDMSNTVDLGNGGSELT
ncbi:zinc finger protein 622 [Actinidia rufa]|uniref:Zinc finger protein 622 n=1 Tax=Actinidia rufa TaxID=165716 RepID=A0A7J0DT85_9ERIC|nr:zinc finger protein 622 [Actinidia rufa]